MLTVLVCVSMCVPQGAGRSLGREGLFNTCPCHALPPGDLSAAYSFSLTFHCLFHCISLTFPPFIDLPTAFHRPAVPPQHHLQPVALNLCAGPLVQRNSKWLGIEFDLAAVTVDPQTPAFDPSPLITYFKALGLPYFYEQQQIILAAQNAKTDVSSICAFCSKLKRGRLYACLRREGYNVLALGEEDTPQCLTGPDSQRCCSSGHCVIVSGQHLDDLAESFLMSAFHNGFLRTMKVTQPCLPPRSNGVRTCARIQGKGVQALDQGFGVQIGAIGERPQPLGLGGPSPRARVRAELVAALTAAPPVAGCRRTTPTTRATSE